MTSIHEQVAQLQRQIEALTEQVIVLAKRAESESPAKKRSDDAPKEIGINRYRTLPDKA